MAKKDGRKPRPVFEDESAPDGSGAEPAGPLEYNEISFEDFDKAESEPKYRGRPVQDKIFNNTFNTGSIEPQKLPDIKIQNEYANSMLGDCYDSERYVIKRELLEHVYEIYHSSQWAKLPLDKKFPKEFRPFIFNDLWLGLEGDGNTATDKFIAIAEFMDTSYEQVYEAAGLKVKELVIQELENKYKLLTKKKINRLFGILIIIIPYFYI